MPQQERFQGMSLVISDKFNWQKLTPDDGYDYFFGYYDRNPWDNTIARHLVLKVPHIERLPESLETAEIGYVTPDGEYTPLVETRCWCHQQGCMSLFLPFLENSFIYNDYDDEKGIVSRIFEIGKGIVRMFDRPVYAITPDGKKAVSLNFGRIPRRGYSYALTPLSKDRHPADMSADGIWIMDLETGKSELTVSYKDMLAVHPSLYGVESRYIWLNHAIFNCDGSRLLWLFRAIDNENDPRVFRTYMYTSSITGGDVECILPDVYWRNRGITHQIWGRTPREILVDADWEALGNAAVVFDESRRPFTAREIAPAWRAPSHMVFSCDGKWLLADSCLGVDELNRRGLLLIDPENGNSVELGRFMMNLPKGITGDLRCDLHPRWSNDGKYCTVDAWHDSTRGIYLLDLTEARQMLITQRKCAK